MSPASTNKIHRLKDRALLLAKARSFFCERNILEVDVPALSRAGAIDVYIDLIAATCNHKPCFLHSSPEYGMKRLLSQGIGDIYQLSHVFRDHELGDRHQPEFTMVEWYRIDFSLDQMIKETIDFVRLFLDVPQLETLTYREAFERYAHVTPEEAENKDHLLAFTIEPHFGQRCLTVMRDFPPAEAALANITTVNGVPIAERFEIFYRGIELANGYHELIDPHEQRRRLEEGNAKRIKANKQTYPIDTQFLRALENGLPDCCGVAVGFDRLMMLRHQIETIDQIIPLGWE